MKSHRSINIPPLRGLSPWTSTVRRGLVRQLIFMTLAVVFILAASAVIHPQNPAPNPEILKKANTRPAETKTPQADPFDGASIEKMSAQCVTLETEPGQ